MIRETLANVTPLLGLLAPLAFRSAQRRLIRARQNNCDAITGENHRRLECHHIVPVYAGGKDVVENGMALHLPTHAILHRGLSSTATTEKDKRANKWAEKAIVKRMTPDERKDFDSMVRMERIR